MKPLLAAVGLAALLTACPAVPVPVPTKALSVVLSGVDVAPVTVTDTATGTVIFNGVVESRKRLDGIRADAVVRVDGRPVGGYAAPDSQSVNMTSQSAVTLTYTLAPGTPPPTAPGGNLRGTVRLSLGAPPAQASDSGAVGKTVFYSYRALGAFLVSLGTVSDQLTFNMVLDEDPAIASAAIGTVVDSISSGCAVTVRTISDPAARISPIGGGNDGSFSLHAPNPAVDIPLHAVVSESDRTPTELVYADRPVTAALTAQCQRPTGAVSVSLDLHLIRGWNVLEHGAGQGVAGQVNLKSSTVSPLNLLLIP